MPADSDASPASPKNVNAATTVRKERAAKHPGRSVVHRMDLMRHVVRYIVCVDVRYIQAVGRVGHQPDPDLLLRSRSGPAETGKQTRFHRVRHKSETRRTSVSAPLSRTRRMRSFFYYSAPRAKSCPVVPWAEGAAGFDPAVSLLEGALTAARRHAHGRPVPARNYRASIRVQPPDTAPSRKTRNASEGVSSQPTP